MKLFDLPQTTVVSRLVPKNAFDAFTNTKQKKLFTDKVQRITWTNKLSSKTVNLDAKDIQEIQVFKVELKSRDEIPQVLNIIDKAIPYHIIFWVQYQGDIYLSTSSKHPHPVRENQSVIDWTFKSDWFDISKVEYTLNLKKSIDAVYKDLCVQISGKPELLSKSLSHIVQYQQQVYQIRKEIEKLKSNISSSKQFNEKVELNLKLKEMEKEFLVLLNAL